MLVVVHADFAAYWEALLRRGREELLRCLLGSSVAPWTCPPSGAFNMTNVTFPQSIVSDNSGFDLGTMFPWEVGEQHLERIF